MRRNYLFEASSFAAAIKCTNKGAGYSTVLFNSGWYCTPIKNGEYWALGLPVVITKNISEDSEIIAYSHTGVVLDNLSIPEMEKAVKEMDNLLDKNKNGKLSEEIYQLAVQHRNFTIAENVYGKIYGE